MKTYKLIKTYPGSFALGHLAILDKSVKYYNLGTTTRSLDYIENHPENWQHVCYKCHENVNTCKTFGCKKEYEILSFIATNIENTFLKKGQKLYRKNATHFTAPEFTEILEKQLIDHKAWSIHSIKRLSDGEVFTVGDKIDCKGWFGNIIKFEIISDELKIFQQQHVNSSNYKPLSIQELNKVKTPLFKTEDGIDIFEGDNYYFVNTNLDFKAYTGTIMKGMTATNPDTKKFSTKKAAENYIKMNKPCLSLQNVLEITNKMISFHPDREIIKRELTKIVKQKLK